MQKQKVPIEVCLKMLSFLLVCKFLANKKRIINIKERYSNSVQRTGVLKHYSNCIV